ncbi:MAG: Phage related protein [Herbinix sp.]|jgi:hypothetical protein|nr:Phage related protein [Herbinix sp.]
MKEDKKLLDVQIISLQASTIVRSMLSKDKTVNLKEYMYKGILPYSLDLIKLREIAPKTFFSVKHSKYERNKAIVNVEFDTALYSYIEEENYVGRETRNGGYKVTKEDTKRDKKTMTTEELRDYLYKNGFKIDGKEYVELKRSGSKAKEGDHLFILKKHYKEMSSFGRLNINVPKTKEITKNKPKIDLTSVKAYEALTGSSLERIFNIPKEEILIVRDIKNAFNVGAYVVSMGKDKIPYAHYTDNYRMENDCFDGESLLDSSYFPKDKNGEMTGMQLLRNTLLKTCAFNTNIQEFYKDRGITTVYNAYGDPQDASKVRLIITPNSLKIYKLKEFIKKDCTNKEAYEYWINNISDTFGVVKSEHISTYGNGRYNRLSYQMINSLPLTYDDILELIKTDMKYIHLVKNHVSVYREHIKNTNINASGSFIDNMLVCDDNFKDTDMCKKNRDSAVTHYKNKLYKGKMAVKGDYGTICSMPWELLNSTLYQQTDETFYKFQLSLKPLQAKGEIYKADLELNEEVAIFRSPHICASNVIVGEMKEHEEFKTWFNFTKGILVVTPWEWDIMERGNSLDFDSDQALVVREKCILERAKEVQTSKYATPVHDIPNSKKPRYNTPESLADLDSTLSINKIGEIVNLSQVLNSYYWNEYYKGDKADKELLDKIYEKVIVLAILSNIEIDKAKHTFDLEMDKILDDIRALEHKEKPLFEKAEVDIRKSYTKEEHKKLYDLNKQIMAINKMLKYREFDEKSKEECKKEKKEAKDKIYEILSQKQINEDGTKPKKVKRPDFLRHNQEGVYAWDDSIDCPMNYLIKAIKENIPTIDNENRSETIPLETYFKSNEIDIEKGLRRQRTAIYKIILDKEKEKDKMYDDKDRDKSKDKQHIKALEDTAVYLINRMDISLNTMMSTIKHIYEKDINGEWEDEYIHYHRTKILSMLFNARPQLFLLCFNLCATERTELEQDENGEIELWGIKYTEKTYKITK